MTLLPFITAAEHYCLVLLLTISLFLAAAALLRTLYLVLVPEPLSYHYCQNTAILKRFLWLGPPCGRRCTRDILRPGLTTEGARTRQYPIISYRIPRLMRCSHYPLQSLTHFVFSTVADQLCCNQPVSKPAISDLHDTERLLSDLAPLLMMNTSHLQVRPCIRVLCLYNLATIGLDMTN